MYSSLPDRMQVMEISHPGGPEVLQAATRPLPRLKAGEVLLRVAAAGVNRPDCLLRRLTITGSALRPRTNKFKNFIATELRRKVWPLLEAKKIRPVIFKVFPLAEAAGAHALMESGAHIGKIVLEVPAGSHLG